MNAPATLFADSPEPEVEPLIEPEPEPEPEPESEPAPETEPVTDGGRAVSAGANPVGGPTLALVPLMDVLPADFALPALIRFVPDGRLRAAADQAATYALGVDVAGPEGLQRADVAVTALKASLKAIDEHFADPCDTANQLHKRLTGMRAEWVTAGKTATETVGRRIWQEQRRLDAIAAEERRKRQEEEDRQARERARAEAEAAEKAKAPAPVVQELRRQAQTATAPPVAPAASAPAPLKGISSVTTWKARIAGSPADADPNPGMDALTPAQWLRVVELLKGIIDGTAPRTAIALDWSYLSKRAKADKGTLAIAGIEAYEDGGIRSKGTRSK